MNPHEWEFVGQFWIAAEKGNPVAHKAHALVAPQMIEDKHLSMIYGVLTHRFAAGELLSGADLWAEFNKAGTQDTATTLLDATLGVVDILKRADKVLESYRARRQIDLLKLGVEQAERSLEDPARAKRVAERLSMALLDVFAGDTGNSRPQTRDELIEDQLDRMTRAEDRGITLPWPRMDEACGPWMPGDLIGVTGYSGSGKSTVTANLAMGAARRGVPVIVFPTEMREQWVSRCAAAEARVPQWIAEKGLWSKATDIQKASYRKALERMREWPWEVVNRSNVTPAELVSAVRTLRRKWKGERVLVVVDHMHRLDYGSEEADAEAGKATRMLKNFATDDPDGLTFVLLYQPKKPEGDHAIYQPIHANRIRGHSMIWNELDVHLSVFRSWVEKGVGFTEWQEPCGLVRPDGRPAVAKPYAEGAQLDTEHVYLKPDKRRVGGEGSTFYLNIHAPSGQIYEHYNEREATG